MVRYWTGKQSLYDQIVLNEVVRSGVLMNLQQSPANIVEPPGARTEPKTHLHGRGLFIARAGWVALTLLVLTLNAISIPRTAALMQAICQPGVLCVNGLTPAVVR